MFEIEKELLNIPDTPKIALGNYLLKLVDEGDGIGNSLYVYNIHELLREIWNEMLIKKGKLNVRKFLPENLQVQTSPFYRILKGKRGISIQQTYKLLKLWKKICEKDEEELKEKWNQIYNSNFLIASFSKPQKILLPKFLTPRLAYIMGWVVGDGCFDDSGNHQRLKISDKNKDELTTVLKPIIEKIFETKCYVRRDNPSYCVRVYSKSIFRFFRNVLGAKAGKIPDIIKKTNSIIKQYFLRGIFDSEGDIDPDYKRSKVRISQASREFLEDLIEIFKDINIKVNGPYGPHYKYPTKEWNVFSKWYHIEIRRKSELLKFTEKVGSSHLDKIPRVKLLSKRIRNKYTITPNLRMNLKLKEDTNGRRDDRKT